MTKLIKQLNIGEYFNELEVLKITDYRGFILPFLNQYISLLNYIVLCLECLLLNCQSAMAYYLSSNFT